MASDGSSQAMKWAVCRLNGSVASVTRVLNAIEQSDVNGLSFDAHVSGPFLADAVPTHACIARRVFGRFLTIPTVLLMSALAEITKAVVRPVSVYVVDLSEWPFSVMDGPRDPVCKKQGAIYTYLYVALRNKATCWLANPRVRCVDLPCQYPGLGIIRQSFTQNVDRNFSYHAKKYTILYFRGLEYV